MVDLAPAVALPTTNCTEYLQPNLLSLHLQLHVNEGDKNGVTLKSNELLQNRLMRLRRILSLTTNQTSPVNKVFGIRSVA
jgi:hypothetical protein